MDEKTIQDLAEVKQCAVSNTRRIEAVERSQENLAKLVTSVAVIAEKQNQMENGIEEIKADVKSLTQKPAKRWESVVEIIFKVVLTALITTALIKLGIGG